MISENDLILARIKMGEGMSDQEFLAKEITNWLSSSQRDEMLTGKKYYYGEHKILERQRTAIGKNGELETVENIPNNRIVDNRFAKLVDQKKNYLLGKAITIRGDNQKYVEEVRNIFDFKFLKALKLAGEEALIGGVSWFYPYVDGNGNLKFKLFPSYEICPFWADSAHTQLDCAARVYDVEVYDGNNKKSITKVDVFKRDGMETYELKDNKLELSENIKAYIKKGEVEYNWQTVPLVAIKANAKEIPLINRVKELQDALNTVISDFANNMEENVRNTILVLKNYDGTDLGEFRKNLSAYGAIKTRTMEGASGGVDLLKFEVNSENYKTITDMLSKSITQNARGFDSREDKASSNLNQLNIRSMYSDIDLDANDMETELQAAFVEILDFVKMYLLASKGADFQKEVVDIIFNRDILINESEAIENCVKSSELLSKETLISKHPWVTNPFKELEKLNFGKEEIHD